MDGRWMWRWDLLHDCSVADAAQAEELKTILQDNPLSNNRQDRWLWIIDNKQTFSVKSCYGWLVNVFAGTTRTMEGVQAALCSKIWSCDVPTKVQIFVWKMMLNRLPTRDNLERRGIINNVHELCCVLCFEENETANHLFCNCRMSQAVWTAVMQWIGVQLLEEDEIPAHFIGFGLRLKGWKLKKVKHLVWMATTWVIWQARNRVMFESIVANEDAIIIWIKQISWGWFSSRRGRKLKCNFVDWLNCPLGCLSSM